MNPTPAASRGLALIMVLWITAGLSLAAMGLARSSRLDMQYTLDQRQLLTAQAQADAAILLALQQAFTQNTTQLQQTQVFETAPFGQAVRVQAFPHNGHVHVGQASAGLLTLLFQHGAGLPAAEAQTLAQSVVQHRQQVGPGGERAGLQSRQELMQVPGMSFSVYQRIAGLITVGSDGQERINPLAASPAVLALLNGGDLARSTQFVQQNPGPLSDITAFNPQYTAIGSTSHWRLVAPLEADPVRYRIWVVRLGGVQGATPFRVLSKSTSVSPWDTGI